MATIPVLAPRRTPQPSRGIASYDPGNEAAAMGGLAKTVGAVAEDLAKKQEQERDAQAVFGARRQIDEWERATLYDSKDGAAAKYGRDAFGLPESVPKSFDDFTGKLMQSPMSPIAKQKVQELVLTRRDQALGFVDRHVLQQRQVFDQGQLNADLDSMTRRATDLALGGDMATSSAEIQLAKSRYVGSMKAKGRSEEEIANGLAVLSSNAHASIVGALVDTDPASAEGYYEKHKNEIEVSKRGVLHKAIGVAVGIRRAQTFADGVVASGMEEGEALKQARGQFSGEDEKAVVAEIKTRFAEQTAARERQQRTAADEAWAIYGRSGKATDLPPSLLARLDGKDLAAIRNDQQSRIDRQENRADRAANRADREANRAARGPATDWDRYYSLRREALTDPEAFKNRDLRREFPHLGKTEREGLIDLQGKKPEELKDVVNLDKQLANTHDALKLGGTVNQEKRGRFDQVAIEAIRAEERITGKPLGYDARQKIIDKLVIEGEVVVNWGFDQKKRRYEVVGTPEEGQFKATVPEADRKKIVDALTRRGVKVTEEAVLDLYLERRTR